MPYVGSVDDHLAIIDHQWRVGYMLSDHAGNPAAYVNDVGQAVERYVWSPFGQLLAKVRPSGSVGASLGEHSVGFQGLHTQVLGGTAITPNLQVTNASAQPATIVHNRTRTYSPALGRFLQPDPLASGQTVADGASLHGSDGMVSPSRLNMQSHFGDGMNRFESRGSQPISHVDASGLSWDPFAHAFGIIGLHLASTAGLPGQANAMAMSGLRSMELYNRMGFSWWELVFDRDTAAMMSMIMGPFFSRMCFEEGTLVEALDGPQHIEELALGDRVAFLADPFADDSSQVSSWPGPWCAVSMQHTHSDGRTTSIQLLRPLGWVVDSGLLVGRDVPIRLDELLLHGSARVLCVEAHHAPDVLEAGTITGRFITTEADVVELFLRDAEKPLVVTPTHRLWSASRRAWAQATDLRTGELLATRLRGPMPVERVERRPEPAVVYNIEIDGGHTYYAGEHGLWTHNACYPTPQAQRTIDLFARQGVLARRSFPAYRQSTHLRLGESHRQIEEEFLDINFASWERGFAQFTDGRWVFRPNY